MEDVLRSLVVRFEQRPSGSQADPPVDRLRWTSSLVHLQLSYKYALTGHVHRLLDSRADGPAQPLPDVQVHLQGESERFLCLQFLNLLFFISIGPAGMAWFCNSPSDFSEFPFGFP